MKVQKLLLLYFYSTIACMEFKEGKEIKSSIPTYSTVHTLSEVSEEGEGGKI